MPLQNRVDPYGRLCAVVARGASWAIFVLAPEVNPVIRELRSRGLEVTAIHSHMLAETPRLFFLHFWGLESPEAIGAALKAALGKTAAK